MKKFAKNEVGCDYVVGDLHGMHSELMEELEENGFDRGVDRLFAVGDLVDRGPKSLECLRLLREPWFFSVRGNHEDMMMNDRSNWLRNGGGWVTDETRAEVLLELMDLMRRLPLQIEVEGHGFTVGIVHADAPVEWGEGRVEAMLWGRERLADARVARAVGGEGPQDVRGVDYVCVGHTPLHKVTAVGNVLYLDTGACFGGKVLVGGKVDQGYLTLIALEDIPTLVKENDYYADKK